MTERDNKEPTASVHFDDDPNGQYADMSAQGLVFGWFTYGDDSFSGWVRPDTARRIIARVNALSGITTEELESGAFKAEIEKTLRSRDELLTLCTLAVPILREVVAASCGRAREFGGSFDDRMLLDAFEEAIARAKSAAVLGLSVPLAGADS